MTLSELVELMPQPQIECIETTIIQRELIIESGKQGPPGPGIDSFDVDLVLLYQISKL